MAMTVTPRRPRQRRASRRRPRNGPRRRRPRPRRQPQHRRRWRLHPFSPRHASPSNTADRHGRWSSRGRRTSTIPARRGAGGGGRGGIHDGPNRLRRGGRGITRAPRRPGHLHGQRLLRLPGACRAGADCLPGTRGSTAPWPKSGRTAATNAVRDEAGTPRGWRGRLPRRSRGGREPR